MARPSAQEIIDSGTAAFSALTAVDNSLEMEKQEILDRAFREGNRPLRKAEEKRCNELDSDQMKVRRDQMLLSFETLRKLDLSQDMLRLKADIERVNGGVQGTLDRLKKIERYAAVAAKAVDALAKAADKVKSALV